MGQVISLLIGIVVTALVAVFIYFRQKKESEKSQYKLLQIIEKQLNDVAKTHSTEVVSLTLNQDNLIKNFADLRKQVEVALRLKPAIVGENDKQKFRKISGEVASQSVQIIFSSTPSSKILSVGLIESLHRKLFPTGYEKAGHLRTVSVVIGGTDFVPIQPEKVLSALKELIEDWNATYSELTKASENKKLNKIVEFYYKFLEIHPFSDGNGTMALLLLKMQVRDLMEKNIDIIFENNEYYSALRNANNGDLVPLKNHIYKAIQFSKKIRRPKKHQK